MVGKPLSFKNRTRSPIMVPSAQLLVAASVSIAAALIFGYVGIGLARRALGAEHRAAGRAFATAWFAASAHGALSAIASLAAVEGGRLPVALAWAGLVLSCILIGGVVAYLAYLLTGSRLAVPIVSAIYVAQLILIAAYFASLRPEAAIATGWALRFEFAAGPLDANEAVAIAVLIPGALASVSYLAMLRKATTPTARWRIGLVGGGLTVWATTAIAVRLAADARSFGLARLAAAALAIVVLLAYAPPTWAREKWRVVGIRGEAVTARMTPAESAVRKAALRARANELI